MRRVPVGAHIRAEFLFLGMEVYVVTLDSNRAKKWVKRVYANRDEADQWVGEVATERIGGEWERTESDEIIIYDLEADTVDGYEWAKYKIQQRPVQ